MVKLDVLTIEVGSTITKANGFVRVDRGANAPPVGPGRPLPGDEGGAPLTPTDPIKNRPTCPGDPGRATTSADTTRCAGRNFDEPRLPPEAFRYYYRHVAQGFAPTSVAQGDVGIGVDEAIAALLQSAAVSRDGAEVFINSSAAGGLRVTVHGLTANMTARAAREASLGAGAIIKKLTAGRLHDDDIDEIREIRPNLILLAGGVDFGERDLVLANAEKLLALDVGGAPMIYAGNVALQRPIKALADKFNRELWLAENVFPDVDVLNVAPLRRLIHEAFSRHIIHAPGMERLATFTDRPVLPTPGAVLLATELLADVAGDTLVVDVGGATTDVHSVTDGSPEFTSKMIDPEPRAKRTVEGDLGVYVNAKHVLAFDPDGRWADEIDHLRAMPSSEREKALTRWLCQTAVIQGVTRHAGKVQDLYTPTGRKQMVKGKDLTAVRQIIGTGGALTRVDGGDRILKRICQGPGQSLLPPPEATITLDGDYLFSALGTVAQRHPNEVRTTLALRFATKENPQ